MMENAEEILQLLEEFTKRRSKVIPRELEEYLHFVARTGDPVYQWALVKTLFKEKLLGVIADFYETSPGLDIPHCPNVDPFNYELTKNALLKKIDAFSSAPFTIQRICELLTSPRKQYNRIDKFMRAFEKNILVVSTRDPGPLRHAGSENGEAPESMVNGSDSNSDYNVDVDMEDMTSWKENTDPLQNYVVQSGSSESIRTLDETQQFINQNGPVDVEHNSQDDIMNVDTDANVTSAVEDLPESSTQQSHLSPSHIEPQTDENADIEQKDEPASSVVDISPADSVDSLDEEKTDQPSEEPEDTALVGSTEDTENIISTSQETELKQDIVEETLSVDSSESSDLPKEDNEISPVESMETKEDDVNIDDKIPVDSHVSPVHSPDTSSHENVEESDCVENPEISSEVQFVGDSDSGNTEMETLPTEVLPILEPSVILTEDSNALPIEEPTNTDNAEITDGCAEMTNEADKSCQDAIEESDALVEEKEPIVEDAKEIPVVESTTETETEENVDVVTESAGESAVEISEISTEKEPEEPTESDKEEVSPIIEEPMEEGVEEGNEEAKSSPSVEEEDPSSSTAEVVQEVVAKDTDTKEDQVVSTQQEDSRDNNVMESTDS